MTEAKNIIDQKAIKKIKRKSKKPKNFIMFNFAQINNNKYYYQNIL